MRIEKSLVFFSAAVLTLGLAGCGGYSAPSQPPPPTSVTISPASVSVPAGTGTQNFTATVMNDYLNRGVTWALSGAGCSMALCGSLTNVTTSSVTYNAPAAVPNPATVTLTATSVNDTAKSAAATITVTLPSPTSVTISPASASVPAGAGSQNFTVTVMNDYQNRGVTWALSGAGCSMALCGSLTNVTTSSVTYNAPAAVPNPATVTLTATSVNDTAKSAAATITVTPPAPPAVSAVSVTITDTPPAGVTLLSFKVNVTGATLNPGSVDLLAGKGPIQIQVKQIETESAFLSTATVSPGTFTSLTLTFADPDLTFKNATGAALAGCTASAVCEIKPTGKLTSTANFPGSGMVIMANSPTGIQVDVNPGTILSATLGADFSLAGAVSLQQLTMTPAGELDDLDDLRGAVQNLDTANKKFTLQTSHGNFPITTDNNTQFDFEACAANNFTCLQNNQVVEVDARLMAGGVFLAKEIGFEDDAESDELEGIVFQIDDATHFEMVVLDELRSVNNVSIGNPIVVTLSNPEFQVKTDGLQVPSTLRGSFEGATDTSQLFPGQTVQIRLTAPANPGPPVAVTTNRVQLRLTQFTAIVKVGSIVPPDFSVEALPALFTRPGIISIQVQTSSGTNFEGVSGVTALADGNTVSLRGLLFNNGALPPELIAKKVRKR